MEKDRNKVKDGNYLLWQADMLPFGRPTELPQILEQIGGIALQAHEARQEQDGTVCRELPIATDSRFVVEKPETPAEGAEGTEATDKTTTEGEEVPAEESEKSTTTENTETV